MQFQNVVWRQEVRQNLRYTYKSLRDAGDVVGRREEGQKEKEEVRNRGKERRGEK